MRAKKFLVNIVLAFLISTTVLFAEQKGWLDRFLPKKDPQVINGSATKPLIEPPASILTLQDAFAKVAEAVKPAVVNISAVQITKVQENPYQFYYGDPDDFFRQFFGEAPQQRRPRTREYRREGTGSGVIIDPDGYILTNNHVVQGADQLTVTLSNEKTYKGKVVGTDPRSDLAVIRIKGPSAFPFVPMADSSKARIS
jgi:serine protease Do